MRKGKRGGTSANSETEGTAGLQIEGLQRGLLTKTERAPPRVQSIGCAGVC